MSKGYGKMYYKAPTKKVVPGASYWMREGWTRRADGDKVWEQKEAGPARICDNGAVIIIGGVYFLSILVAAACRNE